MHDAWLERWHENRIGWHQAKGNASLKKHWDISGCRALVLLCGKSPDLMWLAEKNNEVVGAELSDIAVRAFFEEHELDFTLKRPAALS